MSILQLYKRGSLKKKLVTVFLSAIFAYWILNLKSKKKKSVQGQVILITGAGSGFGRLFAKRFAALGARLALFDINKKGLDETFNELIVEQNITEERCLLFQCDVTSKNDILKCIDEIHKKFGLINMLLNNAGVVSGKHLEKLSEKDIKRTIDVNLTAPIMLTSIVLSDMLANGFGHIINICSAGGIIGVGKLTDYCASKAGLRLFSESLSEELRGRKDYPDLKNKIFVTKISPYFSNTGMFNNVTQIPYILPLLDPKVVVDQAMDGILENKVEVFIPKFVSTAPFLTNVLWDSVKQKLADWLRLTHSMENFKSREELLNEKK